MKYLRRSLLAAAFCAVSIGIGYAHFGVANALDTSGGQTQPAARCARCGDGVCARSCENAQSCPADCGGIASRQTSATQSKTP